MSHIQSNFGVVTENSIGRITIFDTDNLTVLHQINVPSYDYIDVAITRNCARALVTAFSAARVIQLDLTQEPPQVIDDEPTPLAAVDVSLTPDSRFGIITDGDFFIGPGGPGITSYNLQSQMIVSTS
ncbi:hypothetical protein [Halobacillus sp. BBL2006]|uniref:hypothetical protein n=1 Tax=Halobacillus sp. BBL2006 TaxID=1543706 RepID=UPI000543CFB4|nr:hypothetical protein [Halobacillus sp. BBL2006]KHE72232.1 hypothetical protein LD39_05665 [Halobacillus sp. BBL2006]